MSFSISGDTLELTAEVVGEPEPTVQWNKGKWRKLSSYGRFKMIHDEGSPIHKLLISELDKPDKGSYRSVSSNPKIFR